MVLNLEITNLSEMVLNEDFFPGRQKHMPKQVWTIPEILQPSDIYPWTPLGLIPRSILIPLSLLFTIFIL